MVTNSSFREMALSVPGAIELPHFDKASFRVKKRIFASLSEEDRIATVKLTLEEQINFCATDENIVYPVPNKWGKHGWTHINLKNIDEKLLDKIIKSSVTTVSITQPKTRPVDE